MEQEIKFKQKLNHQDLINYNYYLMRKRGRVAPIILGLFSIILGIYNVVDSESGNLIFAIILIILGLFLLFATMPLQKVILKARVMKMNIEAMPKIEVTINEDGILYAFDGEIKKPDSDDTNEIIDEEDQPTKDVKLIEPFKWSDILRVINQKDYIYIHINNYTVLIIKKSDCENIEEMEQYFISKLHFNERYFIR